MKIERFSKSKNGMYLLTLEDQSKIKIHEDLILKYELLISKTIDSKLLEQIRTENQTYEIYELALKYLDIRLRSRNELTKYLEKKGYDSNNIQSIIDKLKSQGYLDDNIYVSSFIHDKILMSNYGPNKIKMELQQLGIDSAIIEEKLICFTPDLEKSRIDKIIEKQVKLNHSKSTNILKKKIHNYLLSLGYSNSCILDGLRNIELDDSNIYQKEYQKLYTKLSKKYSGRELEYKLRQKLYQKGFSSDYM